MRQLIKHRILRLVSMLGYEVMKRPEYERQMAALRTFSSSTAADTKPPSQLAVNGTTVGGPPEPSGDADFDGFLPLLVNACAPPPGRIYALFAAARHIVKAGIPGAFVDCGSNPGASLAIIAAALAHLGETDRELISLDAKVDHRRWANAVLTPWGADLDPMAGTTVLNAYKPPVEQHLPLDLAQTGYPPERIRLLRYPRDPVHVSQPVAFLGVTNETYDANRAVLATLIPRLSSGGLVAVEDVLRADWSGDIVSRLLDEQRRSIFFLPVSSAYRIGASSDVRLETGLANGLSAGTATARAESDPIGASLASVRSSHSL